MYRLLLFRGSREIADRFGFHLDIVGNVFSQIGSSGFDLLNTILMADLVPLKYRALAMGLLSSPYLVTVCEFDERMVETFRKNRN